MVEVKQKDGRRWSVTSDGISTLRRKYQVVLDTNNLGSNGEGISFTGVPAIGSAHPSYSHLKVKSYDIEEGEEQAKKTLTIYVNYESDVEETTGEGQSAVTGAIEDFGWDEGTDERELVTAVDGTPLVNSAGDPFDSVPRISVPAPTFTKVIKFRDKKTGWADCFCTTNAGALTVCGIQCAKHTLLCTVSEKRIFGDPEYRWRYTIRLRYRSNKVVLHGSGSPQEIGWDVAIADAGMRELDANDKLQLIRVKDAETGRMCTITSPELLDGSGHAVSRDGGSVDPYNGYFQAYLDSSFPDWFYSTPST